MIRLPHPRNTPDRDQPVGYRRAVAPLVFATALIGAIVLLGWIFENQSMQRMGLSLTAMNPMTAVCLELSALSIWQLRNGRPSGFGRVVAVLGPAWVLFVGIAKWIDLSFGTSICPDALLFSVQAERQLPYPSRIAPNVAGCFILLGAALLAVDRPRWPRYLHPQLLMVPVLGLSLAALIGYAYDTSGFYKYKQYIPMALHSAIGLIFLATAVSVSRPDQGYVRLLPLGSVGARNCRRLLPACLLIPLSLGAIALHGTETGWLSGRGTGTAVVTVLTIFAMSILAVVNSIALNRADTVRRFAETRLQDMVNELDRRNGELQREIRERILAEEQAAYQATHDYLTGLPNRRLFLDRLEDAVTNTIKHGRSLALFYIDVDRFKPVNDLYGHHAGDQLLQALAKRLASAVRGDDMVARLGGDEFGAIIAAPIHESEAVQLAARISSLVSLPYRLTFPGQPEPVEVAIGVSVGIALFPGHASDLDDLVKVADGAMYRAKVDGKTRGRSPNIEIASIRLSN